MAGTSAETKRSIKTKIIMGVATPTVDKYQYGCSLGVTNLRYGDIDNFKDRIARMLELKSRQSIDGYLSGARKITIAKAMVIEKVFAEFGITDPEMIWGKSKLPVAHMNKRILRNAKKSINNPWGAAE